MMITLSAVFCVRAESGYSLAGAGADEPMSSEAASGTTSGTSAGAADGSGSGASDSASAQEHVDRSGGRVFTTDASSRPAPGTFPKSGSEILPDDEMLTVMGEPYLVTEGETRIQQGIAAYAQAVSEGTSAAREEFKGNRYALQGAGGSGGGGKGGGGKGFDISSIAFDANKAMLSAVKGEGEEGPSEVWKAITQGAQESTTEVERLAAAFEKLNEVQGVTTGEAAKDSSNMADKWQKAGTAISAVGSAMSSIEDPAAKVAATIAQAIATIALTYAQSLRGTFTPWDWIAAAIGGVATMVSVISTIHSATGYAQGGIVQGNSYSGDNLYGGPDAMVNAGELVLTKAQQSTLASQLQGNGINGMNISGRIKGTDIILSVDRSLQLQGKQLLTWG